MHTFYYSELPLQGTFELPEEEAKHCIKVLRLKEGELVRIIDGKGHTVNAQITDIFKKNLLLEVKDYQKTIKPTPSLHIAIAPTKNLDRIEWFIEKATEIGIDTISFIKCRYSERKELKISRIENIAISAMKQSKRLFLPKINDLVPFEDIFKSTLPNKRLIAYCPVDSTQLLKNAFTKNEDLFVLIGPEGDFSTEEIDYATNNNCIPVSLGEARLRTETAALVACHTFNLMNQ